MRRGLLLINLGTPNSPDVRGVRSYLREFLTDKRVVNLPTVLRYALVYCFIAPFRPKTSVPAYQAIWTKDGSPLLYLSQQLVDKLQKELNQEYTVALGMRYGSPSIRDALDVLKECTSISVLPLYPQYSSATTGSSLEQVINQIAHWQVIPNLTLFANFYQHPSYIKAQAALIKKYYNNQDYLLFSYHGLPERQLIQSGCIKVCKEQCPIHAPNIEKCYKAQCQQTSLLLAKELKLATNQYSTSFQSRLGRIVWIKPYTDEILTILAAQGEKNIAIACPSFVTDCLETLEEIGIRAREQWQNLGGERFTLIPSMNEDPLWVQAILDIVNLP